MKLYIANPIYDTVFKKASCKCYNGYDTSRDGCPNCRTHFRLARRGYQAICLSIVTEYLSSNGDTDITEEYFRQPSVSSV